MNVKLIGKHKKSGFADQFHKTSVLFKIPIIPICFLFCSVNIYGQTIKDFKEIWVNESKEFLLNNQNPLPYLQSGFFYFAREYDNSLTEELENNWEKFSVSIGTPVPKSKRFEPAPRFSFDETAYHSQQYLPCFDAESAEETSRQNFSNLPRMRKPDYTISNPQKQIFKFYGNTISITYDKLLAFPVNQAVSKEVAVEFWKRFVVANSNHLVNQLNIYRDRLGLNDWGFMSLVKSCAKALYPTDESGETLLTWALMIRSGYDIKIGFNQLGSTVLYPTTLALYGTSSVKINDTVYYLDKSIYSFPITTYSARHPGATGVINIKITKSLNFQGETQVRKIQYTWDKKSYEFNFKYNPELIRYLEEYPQTDPKVYFDAPFSYLSGESLLKQFRPILAGMKFEEGAAFLQQFVQKSFAYRPYNDIYGYDRFMFPEELLSKEESNDKGKSILFAWMVTNLLNKNAALVEFPGFFSVAIFLGHPIEGDNFLIDGKSYTIADPTFENAPIGLVMKEYYQLKPYVRLLNIEKEEEFQKSKVWKLATAFGAERSGSGIDFVKDESGNSYITGYFKDKNASNPSLAPSPFVAKFNGKNILEWMIKFRSTGKAFGLELRQFDRDEFYLAGSFRGELEHNGMRIQTPSSDPDLFFAQFNRKGEIGWLRKSGLDDLEEDTKLFYIVRFTRSGEIQSTQLANEDERFLVSGFQRTDNEGLCFVASRYQTTGLYRENAASTVKAAYLFRQNFNRLKQLGIDKTISYSVSLFNALNIPGSHFTGSDLASFGQAKLQAWGGSLPALTETVQKIRLIKNDNGIIGLYTIDSKPFKFLFFRFSNLARLKVIPLDNNDLKIMVIDGIFYESGVVNEKVNTAIIELSTGNIVIDLGANHQILTRNLKQ